MAFHSIDFAIFLPTVFVLYWFVFGGHPKRQNMFVVLASYVFYGWWDPRFLILIFLSTVVDFAVGQRLGETDDGPKRKNLLAVSLAVNLGLLGFFKYFNFFVDNFVTAFSFLGKDFQGGTLHIILPVGISFYTFQTMSYTLDVYRRKLPPTKDFVAFSAYVSFFPQLVAGPIERATRLLPQFCSRRFFNYADGVSGLRQILWGLVKKVVIADNCAEIANLVFNNTDQMNGSALLLGAIFFAFQIYGDFSGYSDIAIGTARLFGFKLMQNFAFPYFSRDVAEFWRRWHISLTTWFRDYLYIPLGGSRCGPWKRTRNIFIIFIVSGFWHGANWTFIAWGALHAIYFLPLLLTDRNRKHLGATSDGKHLPTLKEAAAMLSTFALTVFAWIFFRAETMGHAFRFINGMLSRSLFSVPRIDRMDDLLDTLVLLVLFLAVEWIGRKEPYAIASLGMGWRRPLRYALYYSLVLAVFMLGGKQQGFIYFQF